MTADGAFLSAASASRESDFFCRIVAAVTAAEGGAAPGAAALPKSDVPPGPAWGCGCCGGNFAVSLMVASCSVCPLFAAGSTVHLIGHIRRFQCVDAK